MAKVNMKRDRHEESGAPANTPEKTVHVMEPRTAASVQRDEPTPEIGHESASAPEVIDADWVETENAASTPPASEAGAGSAGPRTARERSAEFSFVNYVLLFFSAALLSALVMLAVMGQV
jgi:hypothetical protein